ncbi:MAG: LysM peptidoglycan-binding domain-containing protein [Hyphomicrobiales bacterium]
MHEQDSNPKDNFVMSGKRSGSDEREDAFGYASADEVGSKKSMKPIVIAGAGLLVAVIAVLMIMSGSPKSGEKDQLKSIETRLKTIEEKLARLEWIDTGLARLDRKEKEIASLSERMIQIETALNKKVEQPPRDAVKPAQAPAPKVEAATPKPAPAPAKTEKEAKPKMHVVQKGETLYGIGRKYGISTDQLLKLNNLSPKDPIKPGQHLVVAPAKTG